MCERRIAKEMGNTLQKPNESLEKKEGEEEEEGNGSSFTCEIFIEPVGSGSKQEVQEQKPLYSPFLSRMHS